MKCPCGLDEVTQLAVVKAWADKTMNRKMTVSLTATMTLLKVADSRMPTTKRQVIATMMATAGTLRMAPVADQVWLAESKASGAEANCAGIVMPRSRAKLTT